jgi:hypothetical protein
MDFKRLQKWMNSVNGYYAFALLLYGIGLYLFRHSNLIVWLVALVVPLLTGYLGYMTNSFLIDRHEAFGFTITSVTMTYELLGNSKYLLRYTLQLKARRDRLMVYPLNHIWTGAGVEGLPRLTNKGQQLLGTVQPDGKGGVMVAPYVDSRTDGEFKYWFAAFDPPIHRGESVEIKYHQEFKDTEGRAKPWLYYTVRTSIKQLELSVKYPADALPNTVRSGYFRLADRRRVYPTNGVRYDRDKQWATWSIQRPRARRGYQIDWG